MMRQILTMAVYLFFITGLLSAAEPVYPLWDGSEPVADYAKKVNLPPTQSLDLGNGVKLDLVLIPAGKFIMGTPAPEKPLSDRLWSASASAHCSW